MIGTETSIFCGDVVLFLERSLLEIPLLFLRIHFMCRFTSGVIVCYNALLCVIVHMGYRVLCCCMDHHNILNTILNSH